MSLFQYLVDKCNLTEDEAEETVIRYEIGLPIPDSIRDLIKDYHFIS